MQNKENGHSKPEKLEREKNSDESSQQYRKMFDVLPEIVFTIDPEGKLTHFNKAAEEFAGHTPELGSEQWYESWKLYYPDETPISYEERPLIVAMREEHKITGTEAMGRDPDDGSRVWFQAFASPLYDDDGTLTGGINKLINITKRKRTEKLQDEQQKLLELIASEKPLHTSLSSLCRAISSLSPNARASITLADEQHEKLQRPIAPDLLPSFRQGLEDTPINDLANSTSGEAVYKGKPVKNSDIAKDDKWSKEWRQLCINHDIMACYSKPLYDKDGQPMGSLTLCFHEPREASDWEQQLAEFGAHIASIAVERDQARQLRERYRAALEIDTVGVIFWDEDHKIIEANDAFLRMSGFTGDEAIGMSWQELTPEEYHSPSEEAVEDLRNNGRTKPYEKQYFRKDGSRWWGLFAPRLLETGEVVEFVIDITERKEAEEQLQEMNETLEERVEERTASLLSYQDQLRSLASQLSKAEEQERRRLAAELHDNLGQMLAVNKIKMDLLQKERFDDTLAADLEEIKQGIDDALVYTRELMSDLKPPPSLDKEDVTATIQWLAKKMEKHELVVSVEDDGQPKKATEEIRTTLLQCVREVLFNIIKHTDEKEAFIRMTRNDNTVQITVKDNGPGFDPEEDNSASSKDGGFGLFNIQERMDLLGGDMNIDSTPGEGTEVKLLAPLKDAMATEPQPRTDDGEVRVPDKKANHTINVMLVDDHQMMREGLKKIVDAEKDMKVAAEASDGKEAVQVARETSPDIIIMDVNMPRMDGIEATQEILSSMSGVRIVGLSLHDHQEVKESIRSAGATAYLTKNEAFETLCATIRSEAQLVGEE